MAKYNPLHHVTRNLTAMEQVISGLHVLKEYSGSWRETLLSHLTLALYEHRLEMAKKALPAEMRQTERLRDDTDGDTPYDGAA
jgi:hypothetical protein